ncbi:MAG: cryptochrome/photolyase family protein [Alphaproteobacteria bacterium]
MNHLVWLRNDLRLHDNPALYYACQSGAPVMVIYIFDEKHEAHAKLGGARAWWLESNLKFFQAFLYDKLGITMQFYQGDSSEIIHALIAEGLVSDISWNRSYEPKHISRDQELKSQLLAAGVSVHSYPGNVLIEPFAITTGSGGPYRVFTPFWKNISQLNIEKPLAVPSKTSMEPVKISQRAQSIDSFKLTNSAHNWMQKLEPFWPFGEEEAFSRLNDFLPKARNYNDSRNRPDWDMTSRLSGYLTLGILSVRALWWTIKAHQQETAAQENTYLSELGWRDFAQHLMFHFPHMTTDNYKPSFDQFPWQFDQEVLKKWKNGQTGYPIVDAGMRELYQTGFMHNRVRMITASFLTKHLQHDWRHGEQWFWNCLVDADTASNTASWQWVAGSGADAAPYFRIFNPITQGEKFDPDGTYVRKFVPELKHVETKYIHKPWLSSRKPASYPSPIVDHKQARLDALKSYETIKNN